MTQEEIWNIGDDKAAAAGHLAGCFLRDGRFEEAMKWADKEISE